MEHIPYSSPITLLPCQDSPETDIPETARCLEISLHFYPEKELLSMQTFFQPDEIHFQSKRCLLFNASFVVSLVMTPVISGKRDNQKAYSI